MTTTQQPTATPELGQSQASANALDALMEASRVASEARVRLAMMRAEVRKQQAAVKAAEAAEREADRTYMATPYTD